MITTIPYVKKQVFIVFEAGPTHTGLESAKNLALLAKKAGANAIKFQIIDSERLIADKNLKFKYEYLQIESNGNEKFITNEEKLIDILKRRELTGEEWIILKNYCDEINIFMICTALYKEEVDFLIEKLNIQSIKIASGDVNNLSFIKYCASKGVNIQLDTGNADIWEIERAIISAEEVGCKDIVIHHCPSGYPAHIESINLNMLQTLRSIFPKYGIAFSDHSPGWDMDIAAVALGAGIIEKTITLDRTIKSCEHSFSISGNSLNDFVKSIRNIEKALGGLRRTIPNKVKESRKLGRRSPYAKKSLEIGESIIEEDFEFRRPGNGITSQEFESILGKKLIKAMNEGNILTYEYI